MSLSVRPLLVVFMISAALPASAEEAADPAWLSECEAGGTVTIECLGAHLDILKDELAQNLSALDASLQPAGPEGTDFAAARQSVAQVQAQWQAFVDGDCRLLDLVMGDFGGMGGEASYCLIEHYETRNAQLERWVARVE